MVGTESQAVARRNLGRPRHICEPPCCPRPGGRAEVDIVRPHCCPRQGGRCRTILAKTFLTGVDIHVSPTRSSEHAIGLTRRALCEGSDTWSTDGPPRGCTNTAERNFAGRKSKAADAPLSQGIVCVASTQTAMVDVASYFWSSKPYIL